MQHIFLFLTARFDTGEALDLHANACVTAEQTALSSRKHRLRKKLKLRQVRLELKSQLIDRVRRGTDVISGGHVLGQLRATVDIT